MSWTWWMTVLVILAVLVLIGCIPVGVDAAYLGGSFTLKVKIWLLRLQILPAKPKKPKMEKASAASILPQSLRPSTLQALVMSRAAAGAYWM